jgi:mannose-6-phosphate isomerase-like protein (cupin superfamily)
MATRKSINRNCPFSGMPVEADSLTEFEGHVVGFCNPGCRDKFAADPSSHPEAVGYFNALMSEGQSPWHIPMKTTEDGLKTKNYVSPFSVPGLSVGLYAPKGKDNQTPHQLDEIYIVEKGKGEFTRDGDTVEFGPGSILFVPKKMEHRFTKFSEDFRSWVVFFE